MKNKLFIVASVAAIVLCLFCSRVLLRAQERPAARPLYEFALVKWDGPDRIQIFYPEKFEEFRVFERGIALPKHAHDEEFCVNWTINMLARDGWEAIQLHSTRVLFRRPVLK